jgi:hypothetical protein
MLLLHCRCTGLGDDTLERAPRRDQGHRLFLWSWLAREHHGKAASARRFLAA